MIYNCDIETFHKRIDGHLKLIAAYTEKPILYTIFKACRMKPISVFGNDSFDYNTTLERHWVDEFGIAFKLNKKKYEITEENKSYSSTDLFYGNSIKTLLKNGKAALFATGKDTCIVLVLGQDDYLRC